MADVHGREKFELTRIPWFASDFCGVYSEIILYMYSAKKHGATV